MKDNFSHHLELIKSHYCTKRRLEHVKLSDLNTSLEVAKICPSILFANGFGMQVNIFKITMKSNVVVTMKVPFHVNPLIWFWRTLEASHILRHYF